MQRFLIFLLFISYASSENCKGGIILGGKCVCPKGTKKINEDCVDESGRITPIIKPCPPGFIRLTNGTCIKFPIRPFRPTVVRGINGYFSSIKYKRK